MSPDLRGEVATELQQLDDLLEVFGALIAQCRVADPTPIEVAALGTMLHSFYGGIENLFRRIAVAAELHLERDAMWHRRLLETMSEPLGGEAALLSRDLAKRLNEYLKFRHVFRGAYSFELDWPRMAPLVVACESVLQELRGELERFLATRE